MGLQTAVLVETDEEQGGVRDEEQNRADGRDHGRGGGEAHPAEDGKAVHGTVDEQIQIHGIEQRLRQMGLELGEDTGHRREEEHRQQDHQPNRDGPETHIFQIAQDKEHMANHEADAAGCEPLDSLGHEEHISQPAEDESQDDPGGGSPGCQQVESQQGQQDKGLGLIAQLFVLLQRRVQMNGRDDDEDRQKYIFHTFYSYDKITAECREKANRKRFSFCGSIIT